MSQVTLTLNGIKVSMSASAVPAFLNAMAGKYGKNAPEKKYIGEKDIAAIKAISPEELVMKALALQDGIHTRFSGLNEAIRNRFSGSDPVSVTGKLAEQKKITIRPTKGGVVINLKK